MAGRGRCRSASMIRASLSSASATDAAQKTRLGPHDRRADVKKWTRLAEEALEQDQRVLGDSGARKHRLERFMASGARLAQEVSAEPGQRVEVGAEGVSPGRYDVSLVDREKSEPTARRGRIEGPG